MSVWQWFLGIAMTAISIALLVGVMGRRFRVPRREEPGRGFSSARELFGLGVAFAIIGAANGLLGPLMYLGFGCLLLLSVAAAVREVQIRRDADPPA